MSKKRDMNVKDYLKRTDAIDVLHELSLGEKSISDLRRAGISGTTIMNRLKEGISLGLIEKVVREEEGKLTPVTTFKLTEEGFRILEKVKPILDEYFRERKRVKKLEEEIRLAKKQLEELIDRIEY